MVWTKWKSSIVTALLWGGAAWGQQPAFVPSGEIANLSMLTLREAGKPDQHCRVLQAWRTPGGGISYRVQDIQTGEVAILDGGGDVTTRAELASRGNREQASRPSPVAPVYPGQSQATMTTVLRPAPISERLTPQRTSGVMTLAAQPEPAGGQWVTTSELAAGIPFQTEPPEARSYLSGVRRLFGKEPTTGSTVMASESPVADEFPTTTSGAMVVMPGPSGRPVVMVPDAPMSAPTANPLTPAAPDVAPEQLRVLLGNAFDRTAAARPAPYLVNAFAPRGNPAPSPAPLAPIQEPLVHPTVGQFGALAVMVQASSPTVSRKELMAILHDSPYPSRREMAVETLARADWHSDPNVLPILIQTAREDVAATVRATCIRCLTGMEANTGPVVETLRKLKADPDARVRREVEAALMTLTRSGSAPTSEAVPHAGF